jgi:hypothetical protein
VTRDAEAFQIPITGLVEEDLAPSPLTRMWVFPDLGRVYEYVQMCSPFSSAVVAVADKVDEFHTKVTGLCSAPVWKEGLNSRS